MATLIKLQQNNKPYYFNPEHVVAMWINEEDNEATVYISFTNDAPPVDVFCFSSDDQEENLRQATAAATYLENLFEVRDLVSS